MILEIWCLIDTFKCIFNRWFLCIFNGRFFRLTWHTDIRYRAHMLFWKWIFLFFRYFLLFLIFHWFIWFTTLDFDKVFFLYWYWAWRWVTELLCQKFFFNDLHRFFLATFFETLFESPTLFFSRIFKFIDFFNFENIFMNVNL